MHDLCHKNANEFWSAFVYLWLIALCFYHRCVHNHACTLFNQVLCVCVCVCCPNWCRSWVSRPEGWQVCSQRVARGLETHPLGDTRAGCYLGDVCPLGVGWPWVIRLCEMVRGRLTRFRWDRDATEPIAKWLWECRAQPRWDRVATAPNAKGCCGNASRGLAETGSTQRIWTVR